ncbi:MAG: Gfo/Idh/MocA family oxidoreductase [Chitinophagaceae bacterium]
MKPINTALCSFGMSGVVFHAPFINVSPQFNLYAVWERSKNLAEQQYPGVRTYRTLEEILADEAVELVVVNTPNASHFEYAKKALLAGKHVVVEKPFTVTVQEATELAMLAEQQQRKLSIFQNRRWDSDFLTVRQIATSNVLGNIVEAELHYDRYKPELSAKVHKETPGPGTGLVYDLGSHLIDQALQLFGMPQAVFADMSMLRPGSKVDDYMEILLYYPSLRVRIKSGYLVREPFPAFALHGTLGSFLKPRADIQEESLNQHKIPGTPGWGIEPETARGLLHTEKDGKVVREYVNTLPGNYGRYYELLYEAIRNDQPLPVTPTEGVQVISIIDKAYQSAKERRVVEV